MSFPHILEKKTPHSGDGPQPPLSPGWVYTKLFGLGSGPHGLLPPHTEKAPRGGDGFLPWRRKGLLPTITLSPRPRGGGHTARAGYWLLTHVHLPGGLAEGRPLPHFPGKLAHQTGSWFLRPEPADLSEAGAKKQDTHVCSDRPALTQL